jgi:hypothetical protein
VAKSNAGDPTFLTRWPHDEDDESAEQIQFVAAIAIARKRHVALFEAQLRNEVTNGIPRTVIDGGAVQYIRDPELVGRQWLIDLLGLPDDYLRIDGKVQPLVVYEAAPAHLKIHVSRGLMPGLYGDRSEVSVRHSGGVQIIKRQSGPAKPVAAPVQKVEQSNDTAIEQQPIEQQVTVTEHQINASPASIEKLKQQLAERNARVAEMAKAKPGNKYLTLVDRNDPRVGQAARGSDPDDHVGAGTPLPGGVKVR